MATYYTGSMAAKDRRMNRRHFTPRALTADEQAAAKARLEREQERQNKLRDIIEANINACYEQTLAEFKAQRAQDPSLRVLASTFNGDRYLYLVTADGAVSIQMTTKQNAVSRFEVLSPGLGESAWSVSNAVYKFHKAADEFRANPRRWSRGYWGPFDTAKEVE